MMTAAHLARVPWWWVWCRCGHHLDTHPPGGCAGLVGFDDCPCPSFRRAWFGWMP